MVGRILASKLGYVNLSGSKVSVIDFIDGVFKVFSKTVDSFLILFAFGFVVLNWFSYEPLYSYSYLSNFEVLIELLKITCIIAFNILISKRILYQIGDKEIDIKKI